MIGTVTVGSQTVTYRKFVFAGIVAQSILFQGFFEGAYGAFIRMYYQRIFKAMATTPVTLSEVLWGELLWDASKGTLAACTVLAMGCIIGDFSIPGAIITGVLAYLFSLIFAGMGLWVASTSQRVEDI